MLIDNFHYSIAETFTLVNYKLMIIIKLGLRVGFEVFEGMCQ